MRCAAAERLYASLQKRTDIASALHSDTDDTRHEILQHATSHHRLFSDLTILPTQQQNE
jgi:hypothetical protein